MAGASVLHLVPWFGRGGREQVVMDTIIGMRGRRPGLVGTSGGPGIVDLEARGIDWLPLPMFPSTPANAVRSLLALRRAVRTRHVGILHSHHRFSGVVGRIAAAASGTPFVSTVHDMAGGYRRVSRYSVGSTVMAFSEAVERHVVEHFGVPATSVHRVPMAVSVPSGAVRSEPTRPIVGFFGRLEHEKGPDLFLEAGARILQQCPDAELWIGGTGAMEAQLKQLAVRLGLADRVRFRGWLSDVDTAIGAVSVVLVPSRREGFGRTVLEAMMLGTPVVATRVGGIPELIDDGRTGRLAAAEDVASLAEAVVDLLRDPVLATRIGAAARAATDERYSLAAMAAAVDDVYREATRG